VFRQKAHTSPITTATNRCGNLVYDNPGLRRGFSLPVNRLRGPINAAKLVSFMAFRAPLFFGLMLCWLSAAAAVYAANPTSVPRLGFAPQPSDIMYWDELWHLEHRNFTNATRLGVDINARKAWDLTKGEGITVSVVDVGVDLTHPELRLRERPELHYNFNSLEANGTPFSDRANHGTPVAGLISAPDNDGRGMVGVAPDSRFASWVIYEPLTERFVPAERMAQMFGYASNQVQVQNHSWAKTGPTLIPLSPTEDAAISNAVTLGRNGRGVVFVHASGNERDRFGRDSNDDAYKSDPRVITVAASRHDGRFASYSNPGANVLVAAPSGDAGYKTLLTTDRVGTKGYNQINYFDPELNNYIFLGLGFTGTSGAAPLVSGTVALMLSANPNLSYRSVQEILIHSSRHNDFADTDVITNAAGFVVSHNLGFGIIDAGRAVELAQEWPQPSPTLKVTASNTQVQPIEDAGARLLVYNAAGALLASLPALPNQGSYPDTPTPILPLSYVGPTSDPFTTNLTGRAALTIRDAVSLQRVKLERIAAAGAGFGIMMNDRGTEEVGRIGGTDFLPIPTVFISKNSGDRILAMAQTNDSLRVQIRLNSTEHTLQVSQSLITRHVGLRVKTDHQRRGDLRITLVSPSGTRSVMQNFNADDQPGPADWTYYSTHHFYEPSAGQWSVHVTDLLSTNTGSVRSLELTVEGTPIVDLDRDGLDDLWEARNFLLLTQTATGDPDGDGYNNAREQAMGSNPTLDETPYRLQADRWDANFTRLSWPAVNGAQYEILAAPTLTGQFQPITNSMGRWPENALALTNQAPGKQFYRIRQK